MSDRFASGELISQVADCFIDVQQTHIDKSPCHYSNAEDVLEDYLQKSFTQFLHIQDVKELANRCISQSGMDVISDRETENICGELKVHQTEPQTVSSKKSFCKSATFPSSAKTSSAGSSGDEDENTSAILKEDCSLKSVNLDLSRSASLPVSLLFFD